MRKSLIIIPIIFSVIFIVSCKSNDPCSDYPDTSGSRLKVELKRLDKEMFALSDEDTLAAFLSEEEEFTNAFMDGARIGMKGVMDMVQPMIVHPAMDTVVMEVDQTFGDFKAFQNQFEEALSLLKFYYPKTEDCTLNTCISGLRKDLYVSPDQKNIYIGLDYFLGPNATFRPNNYAYINKRYKPSMILPLTMELISTKFNESDETDNTLLAQMVYYGKAFYFTKKMLPCTADSLIIGYDPVEWEGSEMHLDKIWGVFVERELIYETSHMETMRYIDEAPSTPAIGMNCPGRIGRYLGWKIVNQYMKKNPEVTLQELMLEKDANKIFQKSKFKPEL